MKFMQATAAVVAVTATMTIASCGGQEQQQYQAQAPAIATQKVAMGETDLNNTYPATIKGKTDIEIRPQVSGFITKVHVDEGQRVRKGQHLFTIDQVDRKSVV